MKKIQLVVILPVGPTTDRKFLLDSVESVHCYCKYVTRIILVNDSQKPLPFFADDYLVDVVTNERIMGKHSGLYYSLSTGLKYALENYDFDLILRMDDDALITGDSPEKDAFVFFTKNKKIGMLGSYKFGWDGGIRDFEPPAKIIRKETSILWKIFKKFGIVNANNYDSILSIAKMNGYLSGEHILGGAYFMSRRLIDSMNSKGMLECSFFRGSMLEEDHIFAMITKYLKYDLGDFVTGEYPMCIKWKGMPAAPKRIIKLSKKIVHSVRFFEEMKESEIRKEFRGKRRELRVIFPSG